MFFQGMKSASVHRPLFFIILYYCLVLCSVDPAPSQAAGFPPGVVTKATPGETEVEAKIPPGLPPGKVDAYLAGLSDEQARQVLAHELKKRTAENQAASGAGDFAAEDDPADQLFHKLNLGATIILD
ncbi:hypothetical protein D1AOALGA4SA_7466 [Olavius algarvensis Delta 1 endosymbiont]|nr:hypothetical protein D1AOALGA4SA_7466 [Olavius algarvensis Delta 1 endosymbiont]